MTPKLNLICEKTDTCSVEDYQIRMIFDLTRCHPQVYAPLPLEYTKYSMSMSAAQAKCVHTPECLFVSVQERAFYVLEWRSERSSAPQLSAGFRTLYSLFAWLTLDALIAPRWLFLVFWKVGRTPRERLWEHMGESCRQTYCRSQRTIQAQAKSTAPLHPTFFVCYMRLFVSPHWWEFGLCKAWPRRSGVQQWAQRRNWNTDGEKSWPWWATVKHVFISSATFYLQKAVCLWREYRTRHK